MTKSRRLSRIRRHVLGLGAIALTLGAGGMAADGFQDLQALEDGARDFLVARVDARHGASATVSVQPPDRRLRLKSCTTPPEYFMPPSAGMLGRTAVGIRCAGPQPWKIFLTATISVRRTALVAATALGRDRPLDASDVELRELDSSQLADAPLTAVEEVVGYELRRPVAAGVPLTRSMLTRPVLVERGETVTLVAATGAVEVRVAARALSDGVLGGRIDVENLNSRRRLDGTVAGPGLVRVGRPVGAPRP